MGCGAALAEGLHNMAYDNFWEIIDATLAEDQDQQSKQLTAELSKLSKEDLISFEDSYRTKLREAYHWDLWAAAYIINGGCSDDSFDYFCDWLISRGQKVYEGALKNPESLIEIATPWETDFEDFRYIMMDVMEAKHGEDFPMPSTSWPTSPAGDAWDEDTVNAKYPKLSAWVENAVPVKAAHSKASPQKLSFWQRLFGKP